jgi:UDP-2,3-diacylglucosamine pyrophosphatase LpxH
MRITLISDTHTLHNKLTHQLPGGDLLIHAGDIMNSGYNTNDVDSFCKWFDSIDNYETKIFIAGNHDRIFENNPHQAMGIVNSFKTIDYLQDEELVMYFDGPNGEHPENNIRIYGSPWQPEFYNWAFNLPKNGFELMSKWEAIPTNTDILITHGPSYGILDTVDGREFDKLGCKLLSERIAVVKPKLHICGHIHPSYGHYFDGDTHYFNASVLNDDYEQVNNPITFDWNSETNEIKICATS